MTVVRHTADMQRKWQTDLSVSVPWPIWIVDVSGSKEGTACRH